MKTPMIHIDGGPPQELELVGFFSRRDAHRHLMKHVIRISDADGVDTERWEEIVPNPPLEPDLDRRQTVGRKRLSDVPGCQLGGHRPVDSCDGCHEKKAIRGVDQAFRDIFIAYEQAGQRVFQWAMENPARHGLRLTAYRTDTGGVRIKSADNRHVIAIGGVATEEGKVGLVSCFRDRGRSLRQHWLALSREKAGNRSRGTDVAIQLAGREMAS
jgi:hypothetical protein